MNKIYTSLSCSILLLFCFLSSQAFTPTLLPSRIDTGIIHPCDTVHNRVVIRDTSSGTHQDTLFISLDSNASNFTASSLSGSLTVFYIAGLAKIYIHSANDTIINYSYYIPCNIIPSATTPTIINWNEVIQYVHVFAGIRYYSSSHNLLIPVGYYNLFYNPTPSIPSNFSASGRIGQQLARTITLNSSGLNSTGFNGYLSLTDSIKNACDMYVIDSLIVDKVNSFGARFNISTNYYSTPIIPSILPFYFSPFIHLNALTNEHLEIREVIHIVADDSNTCINNCTRHQIENQFEINYGCNAGLLCKNISLNATIYKTSNTLSLEDSIISSVSNWDTACFQNPIFSSLPSTSQLIHYTHYIKNKGNSVAYNIQLILRTLNKSSEVILPIWTSTNYRSLNIPADSILFYYPAINPDTSLPTCIHSFRNLIPLNETDSLSPIKNISWTFAELAAGEILSIDYYTYRCCPNDTDKYIGNFDEGIYYDTWNLNGNLDGLNPTNHAAARDECGFTIYLVQDNKSGIVKTEMLTGSILGPAHLTGSNGTCDTNKTVYYEVPLDQFCDDVSLARNEDLLAAITGGRLQGQLLVDIHTDYGLNPIPMGSRFISLESSIATGSVNRVANLIGAGTYSGSGGNIQVSFNLDTLHADSALSTYTNLVSFINGAYFRFPITPCCNGQANPNIDIKFYLVPKLGTASCFYCKIPLVAKSRAIILHCPGCVTPGIITDNCIVNRITTGYPDINDNGIADIGSVYASIDSIHLNRYAGKSFMPGDEISLYFEGYGQDGDNNGGFDYSTLQHHWDSLHAIQPSYPTGFTYLYILIKNACAASSSFNWQVQSDTLYLHRGNTDIHFSLSPFITSTGHYYLYQVPVSAIFDTVSMNDEYKVKIKYKACSNGSPSTCTISSYMWWSATGLHDSLTQIHYSLIGDTIKPFKDSTLAQRVNLIDTAFIYQCEGHGDEMSAFSIKKEIKYNWKNTTHPDFPTTNTCDKMLTTNYKLKLISEVANQVNLFPFEYRPLQPDFIYDISERPSGLAPTYTISNIQTNSTYKNWLAGTTQITNSLLGSNSVSGFYNYYQLATTKNIVVETSLPAATSPYFVQGDEQNEININYIYSPTVCATPDSTIVINENTNKVVVKSQYCTDAFDTAHNIDNAPIFLKNPNPKLILNLTRTTVDVYSVDPTCFSVQFRNGNSREHLAENAWLHIVNPSSGGSILGISEIRSSAGVVIDSVVSDGDSGLIAYINHLNSNQSIDLEICFVTNSCTRPSNIQLIYGYSCVDSLACFIDSTNIQLQLAEALILPIAVQLPDTMTTCIVDTIQASFEVQDAGEIDHLTLGINLPEGVNIQAAILSYSRMADTPIVSAALGFVRIDTIIAGMQYIRFVIDADTVLHGPNSSDYSSILIHIRFLIGSCISSSFTPSIYLNGQSYCNGEEVDTLNNGSIHIVYSADSCKPVSVVLDSLKNATCNGSPDGYISIMEIANSEGSGIINYLWNTGDTGIRINHLTAGTYTITATDAYGCSASASFVVNALTNPILLPTLSYQPYTTCDLRADSIVIVPYLPTPPSPLPLPYIPPIPHYTYTWTATNIDSLFPDSGIFIGGTSFRHIIPIHFADSLVGSTIIIRATDSNGCYDEIKIWIEPCCVRSDARLLSNTSIKKYMNTESYYFGIEDSVSLQFNTKKIRINGILTIDTNTIFRTCDLFMEANSKIIVKSGVTLTIMKTTTLFACDTSMWQGIILEANANFADSQYCKVYDALAGVTCKKNNTFIIKQAYFNRNWIDIDVGASFFTNNSIIYGSHLYCHEDIMPIHGNTLPPIGGTLFYPHRNELSTIGIRVNINKDLTIGDPSLNPINVNIFEDKNYGIYSTASGIEVVNNQFNNMRVIPGYISTSGVVPDRAGDAIYYESINDLPPYPYSININNNIFTNIAHAGVYLTGATVRGSINQNEMNGAFGVLSNNIGTRFSRTTPTCTYNPLTIEGNNINYYASGINLANTYRMELNITGNVLTGPAYDPLLPATQGIFVSGINPNLQNTPRFRILENRLLNGKTGIAVSNIAQALFPFCPWSGANDISNNIIVSDNLQTNYKGIALLKADRVEINCNAISGVTADITSGGRNKMGIYLNYSRLTNVRCNEMDNLYKGFAYQGTSNMANRLGGNTFRNHSYHIYGYGGSSIGDQTSFGGFGGPFPANSMTVIAPLGAIYNDGFTYTYGRKLTIGNFNPGVRGGLSGSGTTNYFNVSSTTPDLTCICPVPRLSNEPDTSDAETEASQLLTESEIIYNEEYEGMMNISKEMLYEIMYNDSSLWENDSLMAFYIENTYGNVGEFQNIKELIYAGMYEEANNLLNTFNPINDAEEVSLQVYQIYNNIEKRYEASIIDIDTIILSDTLLQEDSINYKYINKIKYHPYELTNEELLTLQDIASHCPLKYGQAVYSARVLINTQHGHENEFWDDDDICVYGQNYRRANPIKTLEKNLDILYYPNPAKDIVSYKVNKTNDVNDILNIIILDLQGKELKKNNINDNPNSGFVNLNGIADGIYIIKYEINGMNISSQKLIIQK